MISFADVLMEDVYQRDIAVTNSETVVITKMKPIAITQSRKIVLSTSTHVEVVLVFW